ncbi:MAG: ABC transporter permease [Acidobacteria bacterium]|nr:ABC transporter permease [Acidobacteriota bacterium]
MKTLWQDMRYGVRMLLKNPAFTFIAVLALALGIGANTAIFSVVNAVLLRSLPFENGDRLVVIYAENSSDGNNSVPDKAPFSFPDFKDYKDQAQGLQYVSSYSTNGTVVTSGGEEPERIFGADVSADLFPMLGVKPLLGRVFTPEEDQAGQPSVIVLGYGLWQRRFGGDKEIIGREIKLGARSMTVIGVMPPDFKFPVQAEKSDYYMPFTAEMARYNADAMGNRDNRSMPIVASLKPGATLQQAQVEIETIANRLTQQYPATNTNWHARLISMHEDVTGDIRPALLVLLGAVGFVLLITCANVANLLLARAASRHKETAIRTALGASRGRIMRQLLTESLLLSFAGGALGLLLAVWGIDLLVAASPASVPRLGEIALDNRVLGFTLAVSALTGIIFGLAPAFNSSKTNLNESLKEGSRGSTEGARRSRVRSLLVVSEIALSLVLLVGAGLLIKSFVRLLDTSPGYEAGSVLSVTLPVSRSKYPTPEQQTTYVQELMTRTRALPGVEAVAITNLLPLGLRDRLNTFNIEGRPPAAPGARTAARNSVVTPDYFRTMSIPVQRGRSFTERDRDDTPPVIIVNEALAKRYFPGEEAVGKRIILDDDVTNEPLPSREIVGVVGNVRHNGLDEEVQPEYYNPFFQMPDRQMDLVVRSANANPAALASTVRATIKGVDKDQLIWEVKTMDERISQSVAPRRFQMTLLGVFAALALVLASIGIYGVMSYAVTQRTHEIGLRMALGAQTKDVLRLVVGRGMMLAGLGIAAGLAASFALTRVMASLLYGVSATDPVTFTGIALLLAVVAFLASYIPARRATKVDPMIALRYE